MQQLVLIFHGRFPSEKAAGLFADKSADAFAKAGRSVTLLAPRRRGRGALGKRPYAVQFLPTLDLFNVPVLGLVAYRLSYLVFSVVSLVWLRKHAGKDAIIYSNEALPMLLASFFFINTLYEVHDFPERSLWMYRALFKRARFILATNQWKATELARRFGVPQSKLLLERNAVDVDAFAPQDKLQARTLLKLPPSVKVALYTGHLYVYKGVDTLAGAARLLPEVQVYVVGGTPADVQAYKQKYADVESLHVVGHVPHHEVPLWQAAADVLVLPNSGKEALSAQYTSPMKLFEYMASERPIVASAVPSVTEVVSDRSAYIVEPDNARALADGVVAALGDTSRAASARQLVLEHTWDKRAERILSHF